MPSPINNVEGYLEALRTFQVDEVSDNLFINFPTQPYLYPESLPLGWVGGSHNLHQLLVLNQRYQEHLKRGGSNIRQIVCSTRQEYRIPRWREPRRFWNQLFRL